MPFTSVTAINSEISKIQPEAKLIPNTEAITISDIINSFQYMIISKSADRKFSQLINSNRDNLKYIIKSHAIMLTSLGELSINNFHQSTGRFSFSDDMFTFFCECIIPDIWYYSFASIYSNVLGNATLGEFVSDLAYAFMNFQRTALTDHYFSRHKSIYDSIYLYISSKASAAVGECNVKAQDLNKDSTRSATDAYKRAVNDAKEEETKHKETKHASPSAASVSASAAAAAPEAEAKAAAAPEAEAKAASAAALAAASAAALAAAGAGALSGSRSRGGTGRSKGRGGGKQGSSE